MFDLWSLFIMPKSSTKWDHIMVHEPAGVAWADMVCHSEDQWAWKAGQKVLFKSRSSKCVSKSPTSMQITQVMFETMCSVHGGTIRLSRWDSASGFSSADMIVHRILLGARSDQLSYILVPGSCRSQVCSSTLVCNRRVHHTVGMWRTLGFTVGYKLRTIFSSVLPQVQELRDAHLPWKDPTASAVHPSPLAFAPSPVSLTAGWSPSTGAMRTALKLTSNGLFGVSWGCRTPMRGSEIDSCSQTPAHCSLGRKAEQAEVISVFSVITASPLAMVALVDAKVSALVVNNISRSQILSERHVRISNYLSWNLSFES